MICDSRFESQITIAVKSRDLEHLAPSCSCKTWEVSQAKRLSFSGTLRRSVCQSYAAACLAAVGHLALRHRHWRDECPSPHFPLKAKAHFHPHGVHGCKDLRKRGTAPPPHATHLLQWAILPPVRLGLSGRNSGKKLRKEPGNALRAFPGVPLENTAGISQALYSRHAKPPEHFQNCLPLSMAGDGSFFRSGSGEGLSELLTEFPAALRVFLIQNHTEIYLGNHTQTLEMTALG